MGFGPVPMCHPIDTTQHCAVVSVVREIIVTTSALAQKG